MIFKNFVQIYLKYSLVILKQVLEKSFNGGNVNGNRPLRTPEIQGAHRGTFERSFLN